MKKLIPLLFLFVFNLNSFSQNVSKLISLNNLIEQAKININPFIGEKLRDTLRYTAYNSNVILEGTKGNKILIFKDSTFENHTKYSYTASISDSLSENEAKKVVKTWKNNLHILLNNELTIVQNNDYGFEFEPLYISYSLKQDDFESIIYRSQYEDRKSWFVGITIMKMK